MKKFGILLLSLFATNAYSGAYYCQVDNGSEEFSNYFGWGTHIWKVEWEKKADKFTVNSFQYLFCLTDEEGCPEVSELNFAVNPTKPHPGFAFSQIMGVHPSKGWAVLFSIDSSKLPTDGNPFYTDFTGEAVLLFPTEGKSVVERSKVACTKIYD
ncbi:MAG: hypothetical protein EOP48_06845 [Sphingobacteriales bacterium]|nr:MAG: hypothetical protein EOP48_06845 [Sphingobacteriales bacterium]